MAKGLFTQGMCILLRQPVSLPDLIKRLGDFELVGQHESIDDDDAPVTLVLNYKPEVQGHLLVTPSTSAWPDDMGDPDESPERFIAWSLGQFGPLTFPGCLERASEQAWGWEDGVEVVGQHQAHIRLLISYVLGIEAPDPENDQDLPLVPDDYDPLDEMRFMTRAVESILDMPDSICYFNPGGEVLRDASGLRQGLNHAWNHEFPPLDMWTNVRLFRATESWSLMDTVGNGQLDLLDLEAVYNTEAYEPGEVERFLRNASLYMLEKEATVEDGDTADGPGDCDWVAMACESSLSDPPRPTIRWIPKDDRQAPPELTERGTPLDDDLDEDDFEDEQLDDDDFDELDDIDFV